jgi:hypothetical protein
MRISVMLRLINIIFFISCSSAQALGSPNGNSTAAATASSSCLSTDAYVRILYIGNSLTYSNNLPEIVAEIGKLDGVTIAYKSWLISGYSLEDHWNDNRVQEDIRTGDYDFVVLQQGPSALPESQVLLIKYVEKFASLCKGTKTQPVLYMVWPSRDRLFDLDNVIYSYTKAAAQTGSLLAPCGLAWKNAWQATPSLPLYGLDNFHPSTTGSVLAALTVYGTIKNKSSFDFINLSKASGDLVMDQSIFDLLTKAAAKAMIK